MDPPPELFVLLRRENKSAYFLNRGANEYVGGKWTVDSVGDAVAAPGIRAVCLGHPDEPSATPEPAGH